jgi:ATPase subunit of ABC transporter with duplicated ATPase domains
MYEPGQIRCSLSSRVACVGKNGAGKSTMIKLLTGERRRGLISVCEPYGLLLCGGLYER